MPEVKRFRKKSYEVEAYRHTGDPRKLELGGGKQNCQIVLSGDWILRHTDGRVWGCRHEVFMKEYEPIGGEDGRAVHL